MQYILLGPVGVRDRQRFHDAGPAKAQGILAILLMERGRTVSADTLARRLWDDEPPIGFRATLPSYVSRLRGRLRDVGEPDEVIKGSQAGYRIRVPAEQVDAHRFDLLVAQAQARTGADPEAAGRLYRQAVDLFSGEPLAGVAGSWAAAVRRALTEKRRTAVLRSIELDLRIGGRVDDAVAELTELAATDRTDQSTAELLMTALDQAGRTADALAVYSDLRARLRSRTGTDPRPSLRMLHHRLVNGSGRPAPAAERTTNPVPIDTLDPEPPYVAGRDAELAAVIGTVTADLRAGTRGAIFALEGLGGIGKTTIALQAAHRLRSRCPDGVLQLKLHTHDPLLPPLGPREALTQLLDAIGTPYRELGRADTVPALAALWRRRTSGRRLLVLFDDVQDAAQIEPLIPASPGSIALVTSRRRLTGPQGLRQLTLPLLDDDAAIELLSHITERDLSQDGDLDRFARCCGGLPLAITLAAAHLRNRPVWTVGDLVARFSTTSRALADDPLTGPIHTAFAMSFQALDGTLRELLRHIAAHPGPDIALPTAAAMSQAALDDTAVRLDALLDHRLLDHTAPHRFRLHDLLRQFVLAQADEPQARDGGEAVERAIAFYSAVAARADHALNPRRKALQYPAASAPQSGVDVETPEQARSWLDIEQLNLAALTAGTSRDGDSTETGLLSHVLALHMDRRGRWQQALGYIERLLAARAGSRAEPDVVTARLLTDQAGLFIRTDDLDQALEAAHAALTIWSAARDRYGQADTLFQIGRTHYVADRHDQAVDAYRRAATLYEGLDDPSRVAATEDLLAVSLFLQGRHDDAFELSTHALAIARRENDLAVICDVLINLGEMHRIVGRHARALSCFREARALSDTLGDPLVTAVLGNNIGAIYEHAGNHQQALASFGAALQQFREIGDHRGEIDSLIFLATTHTRIGEHATAFEELGQAMALASQTHDQLRQSRIRLAEGHTQNAADRAEQAVASYQAGLELARHAGALLEQAQAHHALCELYTAAGLGALAEAHREQAATIDRRLQ